MTDQEILKLQKRARYVATKRGHGSEADDFAQSLIACYVEKGWRQTVDQAFIDYLRRDHGRAGTPRYRAEQIERSRRVFLDAPCSSTADDSILNHERVGGPGNDPRDQLTLAQIFDHCSGDERAILVLRSLWGLSEKEIGYCFGVTESRICQRLQGIQKGLRKAVSRKKQGSPKRKEPAQIPQEIQARPSLDQKTQAILERILRANGKGLGEGEVKAVPEALFEAFEFEAF